MVCLRFFISVDDGYKDIKWQLKYRANILFTKQTTRGNNCRN